MDKMKKIWMLLGIVAGIVFIVAVITNPLWTKTSQKKTSQDEVEKEMELEVDSNLDSEDYQSFMEGQTEDSNKGTDEVTVPDLERNNELKNENYQSFVEGTSEDGNEREPDKDVDSDSEEPEEPPLQIGQPKDEGYGPLL